MILDKRTVLEAAKGECEVPLVEQLRSIPKDYRTWRAIQWDEDGRETGHQFIPVGYMMHRAADMIDALAVEQPKQNPAAQVALTGNRNATDLSAPAAAGPTPRTDQREEEQILHLGNGSAEDYERVWKDALCECRLLERALAAASATPASAGPTPSMAILNTHDTDEARIAALSAALDDAWVGHAATERELAAQHYWKQEFYRVEKMVEAEQDRVEELERQLAAAKEAVREACGKICDQRENWWRTRRVSEGIPETHCADEAGNCANEIRALDLSKLGADREGKL